VQAFKAHPQVTRDGRDGIHSAAPTPEEQVADVGSCIGGARRDHAEGGNLLPRPEDFTQDSQGAGVGRGAALCTVVHIPQPSQDVTKCQLDQWGQLAGWTDKIDQWEIEMIHDNLEAQAKELAKEQRLRWQLADQKRREESSAKIITWLVYLGAGTALGAWFWGVVR